MYAKLKSNEEMIQHLKGAGILQSPEIEEAIRAIPREDFVPENRKKEAYHDKPIPLANEQTASQPSTVVIMLELLQVRHGDKILEIGGASGWKTALLSHMVCDTGQVFTYEIIENLSAFGQENLKKYPQLREKVQWFTGDATIKAKEHAPYGRVISGASFEEVNNSMKDLMGDRGRMVVPTQKDDIRLYTKFGHDISEEVFPGFVFVPITH